MTVRLSTLSAWMLVCGLVTIRSVASAQATIRFRATADSLQLPSPEEGIFSVPFRYRGVTPSPSEDPTFVNFLLVTPSSGVGGTRIAIGLNPNVVPYLPTGSYSLVLSFTFDPPLQPFVRFVTLLILPSPPPTVTSVVNSATRQPTISPGCLVSIFGSNIGTPPVNGRYDDAGIYPKLLGHSTVTFNGVPAHLLYVSNGQIDAVVPFEVAGQNSVDVVVRHRDQTSPTMQVLFSDTSPGIFTVSQDGRGQGAILNADNSFNSDSNPVRRGSFVQIFATGGGRWNPDLPSGSIYGGPVAPVARAPVSVKIGGQPALILYAGVAPFLVGKLQVNVAVPEGVSSGEQPIELTVGASTSNREVTIAVE